jgi:tripartite-type tricarboxylate transporter receptor subunit TctC
MHRISKHIATVVGATATLVAMGATAADNYPKRPIRVIVPQSPSGSTDLATRIVTDRLAAVLKQSFVVDNRPGAGSLTGTDIVAKAAPDGYTLLGVAASFTITPAMHRKMPFNPVLDFAPITQFADLPHIIVVHPSLPVKSVKTLVDLLKSKPGAITCAFSGVGTSTHLATELFQHISGTQMLLVPYKGGSPAMAALVGGQVQVNFAASSTALPQIRAKRIRALAVTGAKRSAAAPELPTMAEAGITGYQHSSWVGLLAPARTPQAIINLLNAEAVKIVNSAEVKKLFLRRGMESVGNSQKEFGDSIREDVDKWKKLVKSAGIKPR